jgi:aminoglycoside/choline kinase family phosphotransferase
LSSSVVPPAAAAGAAGGCGQDYPLAFAGVSNGGSVEKPARPTMSSVPPNGPDLAAWLARCGLLSLQIRPLPGDVSPRRYYRLELAGGATAVLAVYPSEMVDACRRFRRTTALLEGAGVRVPAVLAHACERGWTVVEDLGETTLADLAGRPWEDLAPYYASAAEAIERIAALPVAAVAPLSPPLDEALLRRELAQTWDVLLAPRGLLGDDEAALAAAFDALCAQLAAPPPVPCHRDLMPRNLVPLPGPIVGVLDHQDLRLGPPFYDLASLLNDSLFPPPELEESILAGRLASEADRRRYHRAAAQRTLKAAGTFAAFARRGCDRHLGLIPPTLGRALRHLGALPETAASAAALVPVWRQAIC